MNKKSSFASLANDLKDSTPRRDTSPEEDKLKGTYVNLNPTMWKTFQTIARQKGHKSGSEVLRIFIEEYVHEHTT